MDESIGNPAQEPRWPSQDNLDRSEDFAIIAVLTDRADEASVIDELFRNDQEAWREKILAAKAESWRHGAEFRATLDQAVAESVREVLGPTVLRILPAEHYPIGPQAEGPPTYIIQLWNQAQDLAPILSAATDAWAIAEITIRVVREFKEWTRVKGLRHVEPSLILTPYQLTKLCEEHVRRTYHPRAKLSAEWLPTTTEFWGGYSSPSHPTGAVNYLVTIRTNRKTYAYAVDGSGRVESHYLREGNRTSALPIPNLLAVRD
jgi:hypothetical protein